MKKNKELIITTLIGKDAECNGDFSAKGSARIDGCVNGNVTVTGTLIVGVTGSINGDITAQAAIIGGEVIGNVTAAERTELTQTARLIGDINTTIIVIDEKAIFQGGCNMNQETTGKRPKPAARAVRAGKKSAKEAIAEALKEVEAESREAAVEEPQNAQAAEQSDTGAI
ncbi:MAG: polymer-forming cytoskeletal protein [Firmicutes bacterium]|nr:polymer-forming cytoskeletal protein [Bacillota bacterium]